MKATTIRMSDSTLGRIDGIARSLSRPRSWVINQAVERFLDYEEWFVDQVNSGIKEAEQGEIVSRDEIVEKFKKWNVDAS